MEIQVKVKPYVGRYPFDFLGEMTIREWGWVKRNTGYLPLTVDEALDGGDPELVAILAVVAMVRAGRIAPVDVVEVYQRLLDSTAASAITVYTEEDEDETEGEEGRPPTSNTTENGAYSGADLKTTSAPSTETPAPFGTPDSDISTSVPERSAS